MIILTETAKMNVNIYFIQKEKYKKNKQFSNQIYRYIHQRNLKKFIWKKNIVKNHKYFILL